MPSLTNTDVQNAIHLVEELECTPDEVSQIMRLPLDLVLAALCRPCQCGRDGCLIVRREGETRGHYRERKTSGRNECKRRAGTTSLREETAEDLALRYPVLPIMWRERIGVLKLAKLAGCSRRDADRYRKLRANDPHEPAASLVSGECETTDPLLRALQRWRPCCADEASDEAEYPPMLRRTTRAEVVA